MDRYTFFSSSRYRRFGAVFVLLLLLEACASPAFSSQRQQEVRPYGADERQQEVRLHGTDERQQEVRLYGAGASSLPQIGGCQVFPANSIFNYDISTVPIHPRSANFIATIGATAVLNPYFNLPGVGFDGFPYSIVPGTQPLVPIHFTAYAADSDPGPYPIPTNAPIEDPNNPTSDRHVLVLQSGTCRLYELSCGYPQGDGSWNACSGAKFDLNSNQLRPLNLGSADAAGLPMLPLLVRYDEVAAGHINHALRFLVSYAGDSFLWPARHTDGRLTDPNAPPEGLRLRLKASIDISSYPPQSRVILTALKHYGMFLADQAGGSSDLVQLAGVPDSHWNMNDLAHLNTIHLSDFEAVDESGLQVSPDSAEVKATLV